MEVCDKSQHALEFVLGCSDQKVIIKRAVEENGEAWNSLSDSSLEGYFGNCEPKNILQPQDMDIFVAMKHFELL